MNEQKKIKILTVNFGGIGDEILFLPALKSLKEQYPNSELTLVTEPRSKSIKDLTNLVDNIFTCDIKGKNKYSEVARFLMHAWTNGYDLAVSSGGSSIVAILLFLTGIKQRIGYNSGKLSELLLTKAVKLNKNQYAANMYHDLVGNAESVLVPEIYISDEHNEWAKSILKGEKQVVIVHPGVSKLSVQKNMFKFWPAKSWAELVNELLKEQKYKVVLVGGPDDKEIVTEINSILGDKDQSDFLNMVGQTKNIAELAALVKNSNILVCVDSAPMHIGVGTGVNVVCIFGPTDEAKLIPQDEKFAAVKVDDLECRPCLWEKRQTTCDKLDCLKIPVSKVLELVKQKLQ